MAQAAIVKQIDHLLIESRNPLVLYRLFTETFGLPVTWSFKQYDEFGGVTSGGVFFGNSDLEFLRFDQTRSTRLHGIGFEPAPLDMAISQLALRTIPARASVPYEGTMPNGEYGFMWRNVMLPWFLGDATIFLCERAPYAHERRAKLQSTFDGGALGIKGVRELVVGTTDYKRMCQKWQDLLDPVQPTQPCHWQPGSGPAITVIPHPENALLRLVIEVESLAQARKFLAANNLLGSASETELTLAPDALDGLDIRLTTAAVAAGK